MRNILLVEDNAGDANLVKVLFRSSKVPTQITHVDDGAEALRLLLDDRQMVNIPRPDLILLDLNLPKVDGREILREIKASPRLRQIPVIIFSSSSAEEDILSSYDNHANCYLVKPMDLDEMEDLVRKVESFWFNAAMLPPDELEKPERQISNPPLVFGRRRVGG